MKKALWILLAGMFLLWGCSRASETAAPPDGSIAAPLRQPTAAARTGQTGPAQVVEPAPAIPVRANPLIGTRGEFFSGSGACAACHQNMTDAAGNDVSNDRLWRSSMMGNAARDPYWQASVRNETLDSPNYKEVIEDKCASCHMPMGHFSALHDSASPVEQATMFDQGMLNTANPYHALGIDGVSCTLCHQIEAGNFDHPDSFSGGYLIDATTPPGRRAAYGPFDVPRGQANIMQSASGYIPKYSEHIEEAALCSTCHVLHTTFFDEADQPGGDFNEQTVYTEWLHSDYPEQGLTCQRCHMPQAQGGVQLATTGGPRRSPFFQHLFVGSNSYIPRIFARFGAQMGVTASASQFEATAASAARQIQTETAEISLTNVVVNGSRLEAEVEVRNLAGHKVPTGYPSRRTWIHFVVWDAAGSKVFESGAFDERGMVLDSDHDLSPDRFEPHYQVIDSPGQVQIYETVMYDSAGRVTTTLLRSARYAKDNRLLPAGFDKIAAQPGIGVYGGALEDEDFAAGGDKVRYAIETGQAQGPFTVEVRLLFQTISFRWAENLRARSADEIDRFGAYYDAVPNLPTVAASTSFRTQP